MSRPLTLHEAAEAVGCLLRIRKRDVERLQQVFAHDALEETEDVLLTIGDYGYTFREFGSALPALVRSPRNGSGSEETVLDFSEYGRDAAEPRLGAVVFDVAHGRVVFGIDTTGEERYTLYVRDLGRPTLLTPPIDDVAPTFAWCDTSVAYVKLDASGRAATVKCRHLNTGTDHVLWHEADPDRTVDVRTSRDGHVTFMSSVGSSDTEVWAVPACHLHSPPTPVRPREAGTRYATEHHDGRFVILEHHTSGRQTVTMVPVMPGGAPECLYANEAGEQIIGFECFQAALIIFTSQFGSTRVILHSFEDRTNQVMPLPEGGAAALIGVPSFESGDVQLVFSSPVTPNTLYRLDFAAKTVVMERYLQHLNRGGRPTIVSTKTWARAEDGTHVPVTLLKRSDVGNLAPTYVQVYGAYGQDFDASFDATRLPFLDAGGVLAFAHVRGGGEGGAAWHHAARRQTKPTSVGDLIACLEHLVATGVTTPGQLALCGESAGGLLVAAVVNVRPELVQAVVARRPFVDVLAALDDPADPLAQFEREEWGDPQDESTRAVISSYDPILNVRNVAYPAMLVMAGSTDTRVRLAGVQRWITALLHAQPGPRMLLFNVLHHEGHLGPGTLATRIRHDALEYVFVMSQLGMLPDLEGTP